RCSESTLRARPIPSTGEGRRGTAMKFTVTLNRDEDGAWIAEYPALPGCVSQGSTKEEAIENIKDAIRLSLEVRAERGMELPGDRDTLLRAACGMWRDRDDLPNLAELRNEMNRDFESPAG